MIHVIGVMLHPPVICLLEAPSMIVSEIADPLMFSRLISQMAEPQKDLYCGVLEKVRERGLRFSIGGALATGSYTGIFRDTKDLDLYVLPEGKDDFVHLLAGCGWGDYFDKLPYDRSWIYRASNEDDTIVDIIFGMANQPTRVTEEWLKRSIVFELNGSPISVLAPEELIRAKLFVLQRLRCDWPDLLNLIYCVGRSVDWEYLVKKLGDNEPLLGSLLLIFSWLCPGEASFLPAFVWEGAGVRIPPCCETGPSIEGGRVDRLDSRPWFVSSSHASGGHI